MKSYISVNLVAQSLLLLDAINHHKCFSVLKIDELKLPYGIRTDRALQFALQCTWLQICNSDLIISDLGINIIKLFDGKFISPVLWRTILFSYISVCQPAWAKRIPYGRKEAYFIMGEEEQRCFDEAGLMNSYDEATIKWWDQIAEIERQKKDTQKIDTGRQGEYLTMQYEEKRTKHKPDWVSIETNLSGYDILSLRTETCSDHILIEVKTSTEKINNASCIISRHEWDTAQRANNIDRFFFYLWDIENRKSSLAIISVQDVLPYIPSDNELGRWETVSIPFLPFASKFQIIS